MFVESFLSGASVDTLRGKGHFVRWDGIAGFDSMGGQSMAECLRALDGLGLHVHSISPVQ